MNAIESVFDGTLWVEKEGNPLFDLTIGSYDGADDSELVGLHLLKVLLIGTNNVQLYRDDGLAVIHQANGPKMDKGKIVLLCSNPKDFLLPFTNFILLFILYFMLTFTIKSIKYSDLYNSLNTNSYTNGIQ